MTDPLPPTAARIGELLRLQLILEPPDLTRFDARLYLADRLAALYPPDYLVYVRSWRAQVPGAGPGPLLGFLEWWGLVQELEDRSALAWSPATNCIRAWSQANYCTAVGCFDSLSVQLTGAVPPVYTVTVVPKVGITQSITCRSDETRGLLKLYCRDHGVWFRGLTPAEATILVEWDGGSVRQVVHPTYTECQPNGPNCYQSANLPSFWAAHLCATIAAMW